MSKKTLLIYCVIGSAFQMAIEDGLSALGHSGEARPITLFNPKRCDPDRSVIVDGDKPNADTIRQAFERIGSRVLVLKSPDLESIRSGEALRGLFEVAKAPSRASVAETFAPESKPKAKATK